MTPVNDTPDPGPLAPARDMPRTSDPAPRRRWPFTFTQVRLGVLMAALAFGLTGMIRNDARLLDVGIGVAIVGVGMRIWQRWRLKQRQGEG